MVLAADAAAAGALAPERWHHAGGGEVREIRPRWFRTRGPDLVIALRAPPLVSKQRLVAAGVGGEPWALPVEDPPTAAELVSIGFSLPRAAPAPRLRRGEV